MIFTKEILDFRSQLVNKLIFLVALVLPIEIALLSTHIATIGITPYFVLRVILAIFFWLLLVYRERLSYLWRVTALLGLSWLLLVMHVVQFGPAGNAKCLLVTLTFFGMLFISEKVGWLIILSIATIFAMLGILVTQGYLAYQFDYQAHLQKPQTWIGMIFHSTAYSAITGYVAAQFLSFLHRLLIQSREQKAKLEIANQVKQEFLGNMSHELNTPLHSLLGHLELLQDTELSSQQQNYLRQIQYSSEHLHGLVNAVLDAARLERQQLILNPIPCSLPELLNHVVDMTRTQAIVKGLRFDYSLPRSLSVEILVDTLRLRQILLNLLTNAIKYTPSGFVKLAVIIVEQKDKQVGLKFSICDSGIGIPVEEQTRLLQPFERGKTLGQSGTGLGLSIVRQLLYQMDSQLIIDSSTAGSCFHFQLNVPVLRHADWIDSAMSPPLTAPNLETITLYQENLLLGRFPALKQQLELLHQQAQYRFFAEQALQLVNKGDKIALHSFFSSFFPSHVPIPRLTDCSIVTDPRHPQLLLIDDDNLNIHLIAHYLRDFEFDLLSANNGIEGIALAKRVHPQLILLDIYMPGMTGFEVCKQLKAEESVKDIPVIFFSASSKAEDIAAAFTHQGQDYILKPAHEEDVIIRVMSHLQRSVLHYPLTNRLMAHKGRQTIDSEIVEIAKIILQPDDMIDKLYLAQDLLLKNLQCPPSLDELAQQVGINRNKLNEEFKVLFGDTVFAWLREQRLQLGRNLLKNKEMSIQQISDQVGYSSQAQFSHLFKQRFGQAPTKYRLDLPESNLTDLKN